MEEKKKKEDEDEDSRLQYSSNEGRESLRVNTLANKKRLINPSHFLFRPKKEEKSFHVEKLQCCVKDCKILHSVLFSN